MECIKCGETDISKFPPYRLKISDYRCKKCIYASLKKWRKINLKRVLESYCKWKKSHPQYWNEYQKKYYPRYYSRIKTEVFSYYSNGEIKCAVCSRTQKLSIDHINGGGESHRRQLGLNSSLQFYLWLRRNNYPDGYRVLCMKCNSHIRSTKRLRQHHTSNLIKRMLMSGACRAKDIADKGESKTLARRSILEAVYRLNRDGKITRVSKGVYKIV